MWKAIFTLITFGYTSQILASNFDCQLAHPSPKVLQPEVMAERRTVFLYIANNLSINPGYDWAYRNLINLQTKLTDSRKSSLSAEDRNYLAKLSLALDQDIRSYHDSIAKQLHQVETIGCGDRNRFKTGSIIISNNTLAGPESSTNNVAKMSMTVNYCRPKANSDDYDRGYVKFPVHLPLPSTTTIDVDHVFSQPLLAGSTLRDALDTTVKLFENSSEKYQFVLWMKGYGDSRHVFRPILDIDVNRIESEELWKTLIDSKIIRIQNADSSEIKENSREFAQSIRLQVEEKFKKYRHLEKPESKLPFLHKELVLQQLLNNQLGSFNRFVHFPYVIWETDESSLAETDDKSIQTALSNGGTEQMNLTNVGKICTLKGSVDSHQKVDFERLFLPLGLSPSEDFLSHLERKLEVK